MLNYSYPNWNGWSIHISGRPEPQNRRPIWHGRRASEAQQGNGSGPHLQHHFRRLHSVPLLLRLQNLLHCSLNHLLTPKTTCRAEPQPPFYHHPKPQNDDDSDRDENGDQRGRFRFRVQCRCSGSSWGGNASWATSFEFRKYDDTSSVV